MVAYGLGVITLIQHLQEIFPDKHKSWYLDDTDSDFLFAYIWNFWGCITAKECARGYFYGPTHSALLTGTPELRRTREYFSELNFKIVNVIQFLSSQMGG